MGVKIENLELLTEGYNGKHHFIYSLPQSNGFHKIYTCDKIYIQCINESELSDTISYVIGRTPYFDDLKISTDFFTSSLNQWRRYNMAVCYVILENLGKCNGNEGCTFHFGLPKEALFMDFNLFKKYMEDY